MTQLLSIDLALSYSMQFLSIGIAIGSAKPLFTKLLGIDLTLGVV